MFSHCYLISSLVNFPLSIKSLQESYENMNLGDLEAYVSGYHMDDSEERKNGFK